MYVTVHGQCVCVCVYAPSDVCAYPWLRESERLSYCMSVWVILECPCTLYVCIMYKHLIPVIHGRIFNAYLSGKVD